MKENLTQTNFGMSHDEFTKARRPDSSKATARDTTRLSACRCCRRRTGKTDAGQNLFQSCQHNYLQRNWLSQRRRQCPLEYFNAPYLQVPVLATSHMLLADAIDR